MKLATRRFPLMDYINLTKPFIIVMLLVTASGGMFVAAKGVPSWQTMLVVLLGGGMTAGGASAINHYLDRDIDARMERTHKRPLVRQTIPDIHAIILGIALNLVGFVLLYLGANLLSGLLAIGASLFYILVYTGWLKRSTTQNIVIGGAAGAMPPLIGVAAVTGGIDLSAFYLFAIIFFWTPPHFWALALILKEDYQAAGVPMLPVVHGEKATCWNILLYSLALFGIILLFFSGTPRGLIYLAAGVVLSVLFIQYAVKLLLNPSSISLARQVYKYSLLYLAALFGALMLDAVVPL